jgi:hypothetical protein
MATSGSRLEYKAFYGTDEELNLFVEKGWTVVSAIPERRMGDKEGEWVVVITALLEKRA